MTNNDQLITEANKNFYALTAAEYDNVGRGMVFDVAKTNVANILSRVPGISADTTELMDFAAGTGVVAMLVSSHCKTVYAVDQSEAMIEQLNKKLASQKGSEKEKISNIVPVVMDILVEGGGNELKGKKFDVITCTNAYHHISDPGAVTKVLASYLKEGGYLAVVDLIKDEKSADFHWTPRTVEKEDGTHRQVVDFEGRPAEEQEKPQQENDGHGHHHGHGHGHHTHEHKNVIAHVGGFTQSEMEAFFNPAGLRLVNMGKSAQFHKDGKAYDNFLAIAQRTAS